jgi:quercetin dioxygenase-like cupin family protein
MDVEHRRFVTPADAVRLRSQWALEEWLCRADVVPNEHLLMVRATIDPHDAHPFHKHPTREELIYVLAGRSVQWVGNDRRTLNPGDMAFIPMGEVHATYNPFDEPLTFLAILSPASAPEPGIVDVSTEEPWRSLRPTE